MNTATIHLQAVGSVRAITAADLSVGTRTIWNFGYIETVVSVVTKGSASVVVELRSEESGRTSKRLMRRSRLVGVAS